MGRPSARERATLDRGIGDRPDLVSDAFVRTPLFAVGASDIGEALTDALRTDIALGRAMEERNFRLVSSLAARLVATWDFLIDQQGDAQIDPRDGALLMSDGLGSWASSSGRARVAEAGGQPFLAVTDVQQAPLTCWTPKRFPAGMTAERRAAYPRRPQRVSDIPPFSPAKVREWRELAAGNIPDLGLVTESGRLSPKAPPAKPGDIIVPPNSEQLDAALERAYDGLKKNLVDVQVQLAAGKDTPILDRARKNLSLLTIEDIARETNLKLFDRYGTSLLGQTQLILFHAASFTFLLDGNGRPTTLGKVPYPIVLGAPGDGMVRNMPPPGLYISIQLAGFSTFRIEGANISKVLFGGVGGFARRVLYDVSEHQITKDLMAYLKFQGHIFVAGISLESAFDPRELTVSRLEQMLPVLISRSLPFAFEAIMASARAMKADFAHLAKDIARGVLIDLLVDEIRDRIIEFLVKKIGTKIIPLVNVASTLVDAFGGSAERVRIRHAIACLLVAIKGRTEDELTLSANVLGEIMADQFGDAVIDAIVSNAARLGRYGLGRMKAKGSPDHDAPVQEPEAPAQPAAAPGANEPPKLAPAPAPPPPAPVPEPGAMAPVSDPQVHPGPMAAGSKTRKPDVGSIKGTAPADGDTGIKGAKPAPAERMPEPDSPDLRATRRELGDPATGDEHKAATAKPGEERAVKRPGELVADEGETVPAPERQNEGQPRLMKDRDDIPADAKRIEGQPGTEIKPSEDGKGHSPQDEAESAADVVPITQIGVDQIGISKRNSEAEPLGDRMIERPGTKMVPDNTGGPMEFQTHFGKPQHIIIGRAKVVSRRPDVLIGWDKPTHRQDVARIIGADPNHPMRPMINENTAHKEVPDFVEKPYRVGKKSDWQQHPEDWESGHARSANAGDADVLVVQTRYNNQHQSNLHENPKTGAGQITMDGYYDIGGIAVHRRSAWDLWDRGFITLSREQMEALTIHPL